MGLEHGNRWFMGLRDFKPGRLRHGTPRAQMHGWQYDSFSFQNKQKWIQKTPQFTGDPLSGWIHASAYAGESLLKTDSQCLSTWLLPHAQLNISTPCAGINQKSMPENSECPVNAKVFALSEWSPLLS
jgi:hypothetical protein